MPSTAGEEARRLRVVAVADSDSYVKWAAATLAVLPAETRLLLVDTPVRPSPAQIRAALRGSGIPDEAAVLLPLDALVAEIAREGADAVLVATRGPQARVLLRELAALEPRPVLVSGLPGISIPATRKALYFRQQADLLLLHSHREVREFRALAEVNGWRPRIALATLPFAHPAAPGEEIVRGSRGTDLVFAVQSRVPAALAERRQLARMLLAAADADPSRRVVVKVRATAGERQTHDEPHPLPMLIERQARAAGRLVPSNLMVASASMASALETAQGLATVSSTAAIEAVARGVPVIALDAFGVSDALINPVFRGSGLFGGEAELVARRFRHPAPTWLRDNYFHPADDDDLAARLGSLVAARHAGELDARAASPVVGGSARRRWQRLRAFPGSERGAVAVAVVLIGYPLHGVVRAARWLTHPLRMRLRASRRQVAAPSGQVAETP